MGKSKIEWTEATWNPARGCSRVSPGCVNCYAERMAARDLPGMKSPTTGEPFAIMTPSGPRWTGKVELIEHMLDIPLRRKTPTTYFVNSMSDLFHEELPFEDILWIFLTMQAADWHTYQVLTKRASRLPEFFDWEKSTRGNRALKELNWPLPNVWLGVSVEDQQRADERIPLLLQTPAAIRFLSVEPLLGPVDLDGWLGCSVLGVNDALRGVDLVIVGGESGPNARPMDIAWARSIVAQCKAAGVPVFVKQLGAKPVQDARQWVAEAAVPASYDPLFGVGCRVLHFTDRKGGDMSEWPSDLRVRQMPATGRSWDEMPRTPEKEFSRGDA